MTDINQQPFLLGKVYTDTKQLLSILHVTNELKGLDDLDTGIMLADLNEADEFFADPASVFEAGDISQETYDEFNNAFEDVDAEGIFDAVKDEFDSLENLDAEVNTGKKDADNLFNKADIKAQERILTQAKETSNNAKTAMKFISPEEDITAIMNAIIAQNPDTADKKAITREQLDAFKGFVADLDKNFDKAAGDDDKLTQDELKTAYNVQDLADSVELKDVKDSSDNDTGSDNPEHCMGDGHGYHGDHGWGNRDGWLSNWRGMWPGHHRHTDTPTVDNSSDTARADKYTVKSGDTLSQIVLNYQKEHGQADRYKRADGSFDHSKLQADYMKVVEANKQIKEANPNGDLIKPNWKIDLSVLDA